MLAELKAGQVLMADGSVSPGRTTRNGALVVSDGQGRYYANTVYGNVFSLCLSAWTTAISAGNLMGAAAAASTQFAIWNPMGSGKNLSLLKFQTWIISGTMPVPPLFHGYMSTAPTNATTVALPIACNNVGMAAASVARALTVAGAGTALVGNSAPVILRAADLAVGAGAMVPANLFEPKMTEYIDGEIVVPPGCAWLPLWAAAGTSVLGGYSVTWEEIPV